MAHVKRKKLMAYLKHLGFEEKPATSGGGHAQFELRGTKVSVPHHGKDEFPKHAFARLLQTLKRLGFDPEEAKQALLRGEF